MLTTLRIKNLALVADLTLELEPGYNVITGETGAGKSILIGALNLVLGERAGVKPETLLDAVSKGSGDSFALRNHARKAMLPRQFPERSFPPEYVIKDISYVTEEYVPHASQRMVLTAELFARLIHPEAK